MSITEIFVLSVGLAMDAFAVAIACGLTIEHPNIKHAFKVALFFGVFQSMMPFLGWVLAGSFRDLVKGFDHWVAFGLLFLIGLKMVLEGFKSKEERLKIDPLKTATLLMLSVATSIDALAAGVSFSFLKIGISLAMSVIGFVTFVFSFLGVKAGNRFGSYLEHKVKVFGGLVLIFIGAKILIEHLVA